MPTVRDKIEMRLGKTARGLHGPSRPVATPGLRREVTARRSGSSISPFESQSKGRLVSNQKEERGMGWRTGSQAFSSFYKRPDQFGRLIPRNGSSFTVDAPDQTPSGAVRRKKIDFPT